MELEIEKAVALFRRSACLRDDELFEMLVLGGTERRLAALLVEFLPMAYCRIVLGGRGTRFAETYRRALPNGNISEEQDLSSEPVWNAVVAYARREAEAGVAEGEILALAQHSAEYKAATELARKGSALEDIAFTPVVLTWREEGPPLADPAGPVKRNWWRFGSR